MKRNIEQFDLYKYAMKLTKEVYRITADLPYYEKSKGIVGQMNSSTVSVVSNIVEGAGRESEKEFLRFLEIARGSLAESKAQLEICHTVGYIPNEKYEEMLQLYDRVGRLLYGLRKSVERENKSAKSKQQACRKKAVCRKTGEERG